MEFCTVSMPPPKFVDDVGGTVDDVGVVAGVALHGVDAEPAVQKSLPSATEEVVISAQPGQRIVAGKTVEQVGGVVAGDDVVQVVAGTGGGRHAQSGSGFRH